MTPSRRTLTPNSAPEPDETSSPRVRREQAARALLNALEHFVRECVADSANADEWIDQTKSPLGRRRHLEAVRQGRLPGRRLGKQVLVRRADLNLYLEKQTVVDRRETSAAGASPSEGRAAEIAADLLTSVGLRHRREK